MNFGFSYIGLIFLIMLFVPNIIWTRNKPENYDKYIENENKLLQLFERVGQVLVTTVLLIFSDFNIKKISLWSLWLLAAFVLMIFYEINWFVYFKSEKTMKDFYKSFLCFPVAGATLPVCAFILLSVYGKNPVLFVSAVILGIGHISIHLAHDKEVNKK